MGNTEQKQESVPEMFGDSWIKDPEHGHWRLVPYSPESKQYSEDLNYRHWGHYGKLYTEDEYSEVCFFCQKKRDLEDHQLDYILGTIQVGEHWVVVGLDSCSQPGRRRLCCNRECPVLSKLIGLHGVPIEYGYRRWNQELSDIGQGHFWIPKTRIAKVFQSIK